MQCNCKSTYFSELLVEIELGIVFELEESIIIFLNHISNKVLFGKKIKLVILFTR